MAKKDDLSEFGFEPESTQEDLSEFGFEQDKTPVDKTSQLEAVGRGAGQGLTFGFLDELIAAGKVIPEDMMDAFKSDPSATQPIRDEQGKITNAKDMEGNYRKYLDEERAKGEQVSEEHPWTYGLSEVAGGVIPAILTGGASAAAGVAGSVGKGAAKGALKQSMKEAAKVGAKYGAVSGAGYSTEDDLAGVAKDVALGSAIGAGAGAALPALGYGAKEGAKKLGRGAQKVLETVIPESEAIKAGYKYGKQGKSVAQDALDEDLIGISKNILKNIEADKKSNNMKAVKAKLDALGYKVDTKKTVNEAIDDLDKITKGDILDLQNKELLPKIKKLAGYDDQTAMLTERAERAAIKKAVESEGNQAQALIKAEKDLSKKALLSGDDLENITPYTKEVGGVDVPGEFTGARGRFDTPEGTVYKDVLTDTTQYKPEISKILGADGRPIIKTVDKGSGKVSAIVGNIEDKLELKLDQMTIAEVENLRKQLNLATKLAKAQGASDDPIMQRAQKLAGDLKSLTDDVIEKGGDTELIDKRQRFSNIFSAEELMGIDKRLAVRSDQDAAKKITAIGDKFGFEKGFKTRQETEAAKNLLGDKVVTPEMNKQLDIIKTLNKISGRETQENISRAGLYKMAVGDIPNIAGKGVKLASDIGKTITSPVKNTIDAISKMTKPQVEKLAQKYTASDNTGVKYFGDQLTKALTQEGAAKDQAIWAISQSAAFRELLKREIPAMEQEMLQDFSGDGMDELGPTEISEEFQDGGVVEASTSKEDIEDIEQAIDNVNQQQSSGDNTPVYQLDDLLGKISQLQASDEDIDELESEATNMTGFSDGARLKELVRKISELK